MNKFTEEKPYQGLVDTKMVHTVSHRLLGVSGDVSLYACPVLSHFSVHLLLAAFGSKILREWDILCDLEAKDRHSLSYVLAYFQRNSLQRHMIFEAHQFSVVLFQPLSKPCLYHYSCHATGQPPCLCQVQP